MSNSEYNEKIDLFLEGKLSSEDANEIKEKMKVDPGFKKEVQVHRAALKGLQVLSQRKLKEQLNSLNSKKSSEKESLLKEINAQRQKDNIVKISYAALAACLVLGVLGVSRLWNFSESTVDITSILDKREQIELGVAGASAEQTLEMAEKAFNEGQYQKAIELFDQFMADYSTVERFDIKFNKAKALRYSGALKESEELLNYLISNSENHYLEDKPIWELSLVYLAAENYKKAKQELQIIIENPESNYYESAKELVMQIDKKMKS